LSTPIPSNYMLQCSSNNTSDGALLLLVNGYPVSLYVAILVE